MDGLRRGSYGGISFGLVGLRSCYGVDSARTVNGSLGGLWLRNQRIKVLILGRPPCADKIKGESREGPGEGYGRRRFDPQTRGPRILDCG